MDRFSFMHSDFLSFFLSLVTLFDNRKGVQRRGSVGDWTGAGAGPGPGAVPAGYSEGTLKETQLAPIYKQVPDLVNRMRALLKQAGSGAGSASAAMVAGGKNVRTRQTCLLLLQELITCLPGVLASSPSLMQHLVPGIVSALRSAFSSLFFSFLSPPKNNKIK